MTTKIKRYKVWDITTRVFHWVNAATVLLLIIIGILILNTKNLGIEGDAKVLLKSIHAYVGYIFAINLVWRIIWAFIGNRYARWNQILPIGKDYLSSLKSFIHNSRSGKRQQYLGHNPAAKLIISVFFLLLSMQATTGLIIAGTDLYLPPFGDYFAEWVTEGDEALLKKLKAGDKTHTVSSAYNEMRDFRKPIATLHVYLFYILLILIAIHITAVIISEIKEKNGLISAMFTGEKVLDDEPYDKQK